MKVYFIFLLVFVSWSLGSCRMLPELQWKKNDYSYAPLSFDTLDERDPRNWIQKKEPTKKRKLVITNYYAEELIRRKIQWKGKEDYELQLKGNATIQHEKAIIQAPIITIDPDQNAVIEGRLVVSEKEQGIYLYASKGVYNRNEEYVSISQSPYLELKSGKETIKVATKEIYRNFAEKTIRFKEYVYFYGDDWVLFSGEGVYYDDQKTFFIREKPVLISEDFYFTSDEIRFLSEEQKIIIDKNPFGLTKLETPQTEKKPNEKNQKQENSEEEKEIMLIQADAIEYFLKSKENQPQGIIQGNVRMVSKTKSLLGEEFLLYGRNIQRIESQKRVLIEDKKERFSLEANYMLYDLEKKLLMLRNKPKLIRYEEDMKTIKDELHAQEIEYDIEKKRLVAKGNVHFKRKEEEAFSEFAEYHEEEEKLIMLGNPILKRKDSELQSKVIYVYKDEIKFERELKIKID
ncbi:MAG: LptA/OstA family protein [Leptospiraceae bacterium]|nr:LptA/OstA family protein [Leptospiraceae bacterium]MDW7976404.1 hypothetical protein [Leptospiraceae bacterium]